MYLFRGGFLDGKPGYLYCRLLAAYEFMIVVKMEERRQARLPVSEDTAGSGLRHEQAERRMV